MTCITQARHIYTLYVYADGFSAWNKSIPEHGRRWPAASDVPFIVFSDVPPESPGHHVFMIWNVLLMEGLTSGCMEDVVAPKGDWIWFLAFVPRTVFSWCGDYGG